MSAAPTDNPEKRRWSLSAGCLCGLLCAIAGTVLGWYLGAYFQAQVVARLQAEGQTFDLRYPIFAGGGMVLGWCLGWLLGWLLTAFLPRKRIRTRGNYLLISVAGLLPLCMLIALIIAGMAMSHGSPQRSIHQTPVAK